MTLLSSARKYAALKPPKIIPGDFAIVLRKSCDLPLFPEESRPIIPDNENVNVSNSVRFTCRAQNVRSDSSDTGTRINDKAVLKYVTSFVGVNHKFIDGDPNLYSRLPPDVVIVLNTYSAQITQFGGYDVEVAGSNYQEGGAFEAESIIVPRLGNLAIVSGSGNPWPGAVVSMIIMFVIFATFFR